MDKSTRSSNPNPLGFITASLRPLNASHALPILENKFAKVFYFTPVFGVYFGFVSLLSLLGVKCVVSLAAWAFDSKV